MFDPETMRLITLALIVVLAVFAGLLPGLMKREVTRKRP